MNRTSEPGTYFDTCNDTRASQVVRGKDSACQCRRLERGRFDPWGRKIPWSRKWQPTSLQDSCLENFMDRGAWWVIVHRVTKSQT